MSSGRTVRRLSSVEVDHLVDHHTPSIDEAFEMILDATRRPNSPSVTFRRTSVLNQLAGNERKRQHPTATRSTHDVFDVLEANACLLYSCHGNDRYRRVRQSDVVAGVMERDIFARLRPDDVVVVVDCDLLERLISRNVSDRSEVWKSVDLADSPDAESRLANLIDVHEAISWTVDSWPDFGEIWSDSCGRLRRSV